MARFGARGRAGDAAAAHRPPPLPGGRSLVSSGAGFRPAAGVAATKGLSDALLERRA
ncbi:protein of unassigned function [Methylobacterium oryzae CBMB20]|uniref:Protein of unassigned function n=1 Tax=Methylobacterium oryzae CBMB20 TaxID=693986 RepID=A0A089NTW0_9HYPH|nr:protein of unassigned function [Methylobacterium oryzae CBMB20]